MHTSNSVASIILAAGSSSRMGAGRHKLLLPLGNRPVLAHVVEATLASQASPIVIVTGHQADQVRIHLAPYATHPRILLVENPDYLQGMSTSIRVGLQALQALVEKNNKKESAIYSISGALITLGDQPLITPHIINTLITMKQTTEGRIIAPLYGGRRGNPTLFDTSLFSELMEVTGDEGGRSVLERHRQEVMMVEVGDAVASYDVDTWEAYQQVVGEWQRKQGQ